MKLVIECLYFVYQNLDNNLDMAGAKEKPYQMRNYINILDTVYRRLHRGAIELFSEKNDQVAPVVKPSYNRNVYFRNRMSPIAMIM